MCKLQLTIYILAMTFSFKAFGQEAGFNRYKGDGFEISYPKNWSTGKDGKVYNFYLNKDLGDISISVYKNSNLTPENIKSTILALNEKRQKKDFVVVTRKGKLIEYSYEYLDEGIKWIIKGIQNKSDFFLMTLNWNLKDWESYKRDLTKSFNSFVAK